MSPLRILLLDNLDSYTYNLSHLLALSNSNFPPTVIPSRTYPTLAALTSAHGAFDAIVISPGPGSPSNPLDLPPIALEALASPTTPSLGVCLGHQGLCAAAGARITRSSRAIHGRTSQVVPAAACPLFDGLPRAGFPVVRYHSLVVDRATLPASLVATAWTTDRLSHEPVLMGVRHAYRPAFGLQFHPESVLTAHGRALASNFLTVARAYASPVPRPLRAAPALAGRGEKERARRLVAPVKKRLRAVARQVEGVAAGSGDVFCSLFAKEERAFWLDSSSSESSPSLSRCSSVETQTFSAHSGEEAGVGVRMRGRFSFMGDLKGPRAELVTYRVGKGVDVCGPRGDMRQTMEGMTIFDYLETELKARKVDGVPGLPVEMCGGYVGFCGYEAKADVAGVDGNRHISKLPDAWFVFADRLLIFDHADDSVWMVGLVGVGAGDEQKDETVKLEEWFDVTEKVILDSAPSVSVLSTGFKGLAPGEDRRSGRGECDLAAAISKGALRFSLERGREQYEGDVSQCLELIAAGESYEICLTNRLHTELPEVVDVLSIYRTLRLVNPAPYAAFLRLGGDTAICCSSPERFLRASADGTIESKPIKGTRPRGGSVVEDEMLAADLRSCEKDRRENLMIVDLVRNDLSRTCDVGSVTVPVLMEVETYASVHQLVSTVRGQRRDGISSVRVIREAYPMGSMTGAPKVRTMSLIDNLESSARGVYSGTIGYMSACGAADLNVVIRTAVVQGKNVAIGVGGAVVALSEPEEEFKEILVKGRAIMQTIALASSGSNAFVVEEDYSRRISEVNHSE